MRREMRLFAELCLVFVVHVDNFVELAAVVVQ